MLNEEMKDALVQLFEETEMSMGDMEIALTLIWREQHMVKMLDWMKRHMDADADSILDKAEEIRLADKSIPSIQSSLELIGRTGSSRETLRP